MPTSRFIHLKPEEDTQLRKMEQDPYLKPKVRLRAQVLRLSHRQSSVEQIAGYTGRSRTSIGRDFDRWEQRGLEGLADGSAPGNPPRVTEEVISSFSRINSLRSEPTQRKPACRNGRGALWD